MMWVLIAIYGWNRTCLEIDGENCTSLNDIEGGEYFDGVSIPRQKGGGSHWSRCVVRFSEAGNRKLQRQCGRGISFVCRTLFEIIFLQEL
jgi:hypothetical protein